MLSGERLYLCSEHFTQGQLIEHGTRRCSEVSGHTPFPLRSGEQGDSVLDQAVNEVGEIWTSYSARSSEKVRALDQGLHEFFEISDLSSAGSGE